MDNKGTSAEQSPSGRRRSSGPSFEGLMAQKRSNDPVHMARRQSLHDQKPQAGFFGSMWHNFTRGPGSPPK
ncbi:hypothetical protein Micbo1qcDRAFT_231119 [Microdochium bolleyi]|uniref:Conidiation-specific protein 8 n=1 Tax=Microdochium bolleyi TaxID=196109 RepID=A0A136JFN1_9PEZI|nr:hypothetical protein Micbo1qcDRAFT_231119 [Microdochium bolleyi]